MTLLVLIMSNDVGTAPAPLEDLRVPSFSAFELFVAGPNGPRRMVMMRTSGGRSRRDVQQEGHRRMGHEGETPQQTVKEFHEAARSGRFVEIRALMSPASIERVTKWARPSQLKMTRDAFNQALHGQ